MIKCLLVYNVFGLAVKYNTTDGRNADSVIKLPERAILYLSSRPNLGKIRYNLPPILVTCN